MRALKIGSLLLGGIMIVIFMGVVAFGGNQIQPVTQLSAVLHASQPEQPEDTEAAPLLEPIAPDRHGDDVRAPADERAFIMSTLSLRPKLPSSDSAYIKKIAGEKITQDACKLLPATTELMEWTGKIVKIADSAKIIVNINQLSSKKADDILLQAGVDGKDALSATNKLQGSENIIFSGRFTSKNKDVFCRSGPRIENTYPINPMILDVDIDSFKIIKATSAE